MEERTGLVLIGIILIVLSAAVGVAIAQDLTTHEASEGSVYETNDGLEVVLGMDRSIPSVPWTDNQTIEVDGTSISSPGDARVEVNSFSDGFEASGIEASTNDITISPAGTNTVTVGGGTNSLSFDAIEVGDDVVDVEIAGDEEMTLVVEGVPGDRGTQAVDANTGEVVALDTATDGGSAEFNIAPGSYELLLERGPSELQIRDETDPDSLITENGEIEVRFFATESDEVITRTAENGAIDMSGLPGDEPLIASANIDGYAQRSIAIDSIIDQQRLYLLPDTEDSSQIDWVLDDESGTFTATETTLQVERALEVDGETQWRVIAGERFGATERVATQLATDDRYRLRVSNDAGDVRLLGSYTAAGAAQETLRIGQVGFPGAEDSGAALTAFVDNEDGVLEYRYADERERTQELTVTVTRLSDGEVVHESTLSGPIHTTREQISLEDIGHSEDEAYSVEYSADRGTTGVIEGDRQIGDIPELAKDWGLDPRILEIFGFATILGVFGATVILRPRHAGLVASVVAMGLVLIGAIQINRILIGFAFVVSGLFAAAGGGR